MRRALTSWEMPRSTMSRPRWVEASSSTSQKAILHADAATASCRKARNRQPAPAVPKSTTTPRPSNNILRNSRLAVMGQPVQHQAQEVAHHEAESYDVEKIRLDFPILKRIINGKPLTYLDNAATSQRPVQVVEAMDRFYAEYNANVFRGVYRISEEATVAYERARKKIAGFINARDPSEIIFVRGTTEGINLVAESWGWSNIGLGDG